MKHCRFGAIILLLLFIMTACGTLDTKQTETAKSQEFGVQKLKIGVITTRTKEDGGWCQAQYIGLEEAMNALGIDAVSYTHLDVYKRQLDSWLVNSFGIWLSGRTQMSLFAG